MKTTRNILVEFFIFIDDDDEKWWSKLNTCKWLKHISKTLHGAASLAKLLNFKNIELAGKRRIEIVLNRTEYFDI